MINSRQLERATHLKSKPATEKGERNIFKRMVITFTKLIDPHDGSIIKHITLTARLGSFFKALT